MEAAAEDLVVREKYFRAACRRLDFEPRVDVFAARDNH